MSTQFHSHDSHDLLSLRIFFTALLIALTLMFVIAEKAASGLLAQIR